MCFGGSILVPPSEKASAIAAYYKIAIFVQVCLVFVLILPGKWSDLLKIAVCALIGWLAIRQPEGYDVQRVMCYTIFSGYLCIMAVIPLILFIFGIKDFQDDKVEVWQRYAFGAIIVATPLVLSVSTATAYYLYEELRSTSNGMNGGGNAASAVSGGGGGASAAGSGGEGHIWRHQASSPGANPYADDSPAPSASSGSSGFQPFSGKGNRLGGAANV